MAAREGTGAAVRLAPTRATSGLLWPLNALVEGLGRARGLLCHPTAARREREARAFEALCEALNLGTARDVEALAEGFRQSLRPHHTQYAACVSPAWMTISLELAAFLQALCARRRPARVVDLGSGFSSFALRQYQLQANPAPEVWSVDDDDRWLNATRRFLEYHHLATDHLALWDTFIADEPGRFDLVVHDLGSLRVRRETLRQVVALAAPGGIVVIDDVNYGGFRRYAQRTLADLGAPHHMVEAATRDCFGRYAMVVAP